MRGFSLVAAAFSALVGLTQALPLIVHPGDASDLIITDQDTVNGTLVTPGTVPHEPPAQANARLQLSFINNFPGSGQVNAYVTGNDPSNRVVMLQPNGAWYYPSSGGSSTPQPVNANVAIPLGGRGSTTKITLPDYISAARIWFANGNLKFYVVAGGGRESLVEPSAVNPSDPSANVNWGFVELTNNSGGIYANISYVDFVGLVLGMSLTGSSGTQTAKGLSANAVPSICSDLQAQTNKDGAPWADLCVKDSSGKPLRVLSPQDYLSIKPSAFSNYWTSYVNSVWSHYTSTPLTINTQAAAGKVNCQVNGSGVLNCAGDNRGYNKPTAGDIFGCNSGPFGIQGGDNAVHYAVVPRLCAAFDRSTLLLNGGNVQPNLGSANYYTTSPTNHYSRIVHKYEVDGKGYAFSYDDVNPSGENQSGVLSDPNPSVLAITVGGPQ